MSGPQSRPLRVLVVAAREPWPLNSGGRIRLYHILRGLCRETDVTLALMEPAQHAAHLPPDLRIAEMSGGGCGAVGPEPAVPWVVRLARRHFGTQPAVFRWLAQHATPQRFDAALLYGAVTGQYAGAVRVPTVWDPVDELVLYTVRDAARHGIGRWAPAARGAALYALFERHVARHSFATIFASGVDASYARRWIGDARVATISNGVDFAYFAGPTRPPAAGTVAFVGSLSFPPNVEAMTRFVGRIWPHVRAGGPERRLLIVGRAPVPAVRELARVPGVAVHADVADVRPFLSEAAVVVVPTHLGGGVKNKVLEACAMRRPVVASPRALAGLTARRGQDVLCAARVETWVQQVHRPSQSLKLVASGRTHRLGQQVAARAGQHQAGNDGLPGPVTHMQNPSAGMGPLLPPIRFTITLFIKRDFGLINQDFF